MAKLSKRQAAIKAKLVPGKLYSIDEAVSFLSELPPSKIQRVD
jgi:large subunit ribosomal protein L1